MINDDTPTDPTDDNSRHELIDALARMLGPGSAQTQHRSLLENINENPGLVRAHQFEDINRIRAMCDEMERTGFRGVVFSFVLGDLLEDLPATHKHEVIGMSSGDPVLIAHMARQMQEEVMRQVLAAERGEFVDDGSSPTYEMPAIPDDIMRAFMDEPTEDA